MRSRENITWCNSSGDPSYPSALQPLTFIGMILSGKVKASADDLVFRDPDSFMAGELHHHVDAWETVLEGFYKKQELLGYIFSGVSVFDFFQPFKGKFKGQSYSSDMPPQIHLSNSASCKGFEDFISNCILDRIANGSLAIWGKVGTCAPPYLVMPITIEPSKPRMCHDERYLDLWMNPPTSNPPPGPCHRSSSLLWQRLFPD